MAVYRSFGYPDRDPETGTAALQPEEDCAAGPGGLPGHDPETGTATLQIRGRGESHPQRNRDSGEGWRQSRRKSNLSHCSRVCCGYPD